MAQLLPPPATIRHTNLVTAMALMMIRPHSNDRLQNVRHSTPSISGTARADTVVSIVYSPVSHSFSNLRNSRPLGRLAREPGTRTCWPAERRASTMPERLRRYEK
jgi:hypothetical protein